jgi:peroxiredoxin
MQQKHGMEIDWTELPQPVDDGAAGHLAGCRLPDLHLSATTGHTIDVGALDGVSVLYVYPMTGTPGVALPEGWNEIPGARGCTPQACGFRDHFADLQAAGARHVFGISTQTPTQQAEAAERLHLPFPLLSDADEALASALSLPMFATSAGRHHKRLTLIARDGKIEQVFYPVFPPDTDAPAVLAWLTTHCD